jgi:hypothetical protein
MGLIGSISSAPLFHFAFPDFALRAGRELGIHYAAGIMGAALEKV